jgi:predicted lipoprotein with Yx(FWY)xxD motif
MVTRSRPAVTIVPALCLVLLSACTAATPAAPASSAAAPASSAPASSMPASAPAEADATTLTLAMADSSLGSILVDGKGMTLYLFTKDTPNASNCTGQCLVAWPPLLGKPTAGKGVDATKLDSFSRADGSTQASYNGWPLYYWQQDAKPGDVTGQDVNSVWYVLDRNGAAVKG